MKPLSKYIKESYICEADDEPSAEELGTSGAERDEKTTERGDIKFTIWNPSGKKVKWLEPNQPYRKIEYLFSNSDEGIEIDFLLGKDKDGSWKLWMGKNGAVSYDNKPYKDLKTDKFAPAVVNALDTVEEILKDVRENADKWVQFYVHR